MDKKYYVFEIDGQIRGRSPSNRLGIDGREAIPHETTEELYNQWKDLVIGPDGQLAVSEEKVAERKRTEVRAVRNKYLAKYVDPKQLVLIWEGLTQEEKDSYVGYRRYLLDYTETESWWEKNPMTYDEWKDARDGD